MSTPDWSGDSSQGDDHPVPLPQPRERRGAWRAWTFNPGVPFRTTDYAISQMRRSAPTPRPNWVRVYDGWLRQLPQIPAHVWVRCRMVTESGFWIDTLSGEPVHVLDHQVSDIRAGDPPGEYRFEIPDDVAGSWDDDVGQGPMPDGKPLGGCEPTP